MLEAPAPANAGNSNTSKCWRLYSCKRWKLLHLQMLSLATLTLASAGNSSTSRCWKLQHQQILEALHPCWKLLHLQMLNLERRNSLCGSGPDRRFSGPSGGPNSRSWKTGLFAKAPNLCKFFMWECARSIVFGSILGDPPFQELEN